MVKLCLNLTDLLAILAPDPKLNLGGLYDKVFHVLVVHPSVTQIGSIEESFICTISILFPFSPLCTTDEPEGTE